MADEPQQERADQPPVRHRSVTDFDSEDCLCRALLTSSAAAGDCNGGEENGGEECLDWVLPNIDPETTKPQSMKEELQRLQVLKSYLILDNEPEEAFERITALTCRIFKAPIALVSLVDLGRQWFMSNRGLEKVRETSRSVSLCAHAIQAKTNHLVVTDATEDFRFKDNPLVTASPFVRFYAGAPLVSPEGSKVCLLDGKPQVDCLPQSALIDLL